METTPIAAATATKATPTEKPAEKPDASAALSSDFETFLKMLTVQMENQDPLNPMDSTEFAIQLATFSGVEQQVRTNDLLKSLGTQFAVMGMSQMAGWVGMEARSSGPTFFDGAPIRLEPQPASAATEMALVVKNAEGEVVGRQEMKASKEPLEWAGVTEAGAPFEKGLYSFELESLNGGTLLNTKPIETFAQVAEARNKGGELMLVLKGGAEIKAADVTALREPR